MPRLLLVGLALSGSLAVTPRMGTPIANAPADADKKTVAVLAFDNNSGKPDFEPLGRGLSAMMTSDLASVDALQLVERDRLADLTREIDHAGTKWFDSTTAVKAGRLVSAQYVVTGSFITIDPAIRIDTRVIHVETGAIVKTAKVTGQQDQLFELQQKLARSLVKDLDVALSPAAEAQLAERQANNRVDDMPTMLRFSEGVRLSDQRDYAGATLKLAPLAFTAQSALIKLTYDEVRRRATARTNAKVDQEITEQKRELNAQVEQEKRKAADKVKKGIGGLFKKPD
ncbi:MAG: CsgG/HfaB family protein [Gemmatimonadaceae bacterium]|jgi:TolB-like protein|nr:CsgG/HfaB family protein [Gemmatimonadaceae bacterium]